MLNRKFFPDIPYSAPLMTKEGDAILRVWPALACVPAGGRPYFWMQVDPIKGNPTPYGRFTALVTEHPNGAISFSYTDGYTIARRLVFDQKNGCMCVTIYRGEVLVKENREITAESTELIEIIREQMGLYCG